jgi:hypothetical protein
MNFDAPDRPNSTIVANVVRLLRGLYPLALAGPLMGLRQGQAEEWLRRGLAGERPFVAFARAVDGVRQEIEAIGVAIIAGMNQLRQQAVDGDEFARKVLTVNLGLAPSKPRSRTKPVKRLIRKRSS